MANNPESLFPGKIEAASTEFPYGKARNITLPGDGTGTPFVAALVNDIFGFQQSLLSEASIVPSGTPDEVGASQYLEALKIISRSMTITNVAKTWYVDSVLGTDDLDHGTGTGTDAFKTVQFAWDQLPEIILHQQIIQLADGTYNTSSIIAADQPRPAVLWGKGKITPIRSYGSGVDIKAMISIRGNAADAMAVKIETGADYKYGIYINKGNIGLQDLTVKTDNVNVATALIVAHRTDTYIHMLNCIIDGMSVSKCIAGMNAESSGQIEFVQGVSGAIKNCATGVQTLTAGDNISISCHGFTMFSGCTKAVLAKSNSWIALNAGRDGDGKTEIIDATNVLGIEAIGGAQVDVRGQDSTTDMAQINAPVTVEGGANLTFVFAESLDTVTVKNSTVKYNASNYQKNILLHSSTIHLETSNSYVSPATANTDVRPIQLLSDSIIYQEGTNNINGSGGLTVPTSFPTSLTFSANNEVKAPVYGRYDVKVSSDVSGPYTGCEIDSTDIVEGRIINVTFNNDNVNNVQFIGTGVHMLFTDNITLGKTSGHYTGAIFQMIDGKWRIIGLGQLIA